MKMIMKTRRVNTMVGMFCEIFLPFLKLQMITLSDDCRVEESLSFLRDCAKLRDCAELAKHCVVCEAAVSASFECSLERQTSGSTPDPLSQNLHFSKLSSDSSVHVHY